MKKTKRKSRTFDEISRDADLYWNKELKKANKKFKINSK